MEEYNLKVQERGQIQNQKEEDLRKLIIFIYRMIYLIWHIGLMNQI